MVSNNTELVDEFICKVDKNLHIVENFTANQDYMSEYDPSVPIQVFYALLFVILETVGNFLLFCMIVYEKYGMDAQKRTVTNQLLSSICWCVILYNIFSMPFITIARIFGPTSKFPIKV